MTEQEWLVSQNPQWLVDRNYSAQTTRKQRLAGVAICRLLLPLLIDKRLVACVNAVEELADIPCHRLGKFADRLGLRGWQWSQKLGGRIEQAGLAVRLLTLLDTVCAPYTLIGYAKEAANLDGSMETFCTNSSALIRDIFGNPFRPVTFDPAWRSESAVALARTAYDTRDFTLLPVLADALEEAGCDHADVLAHCRETNGVHVRGCWVVDLVLNKS